MSLKSNKGLLSLTRCVVVLIPLKKFPNLFCFFSLPTFSLLWQMRPQGGSFPQSHVRARGKEREREEKKSCKYHFTSTVPLESITQATLLMLKQHCLEH